jgi:hypothetical protein
MTVTEAKEPYLLFISFLNGTFSSYLTIEESDP